MAVTFKLRNIEFTLLINNQIFMSSNMFRMEQRQPSGIPVRIPAHHMGGPWFESRLLGSYGGYPATTTPESLNHVTWITPTPLPLPKKQGFRFSQRVGQCVIRPDTGFTVEYKFGVSTIFIDHDPLRFNYLLCQTVASCLSPLCRADKDKKEAVEEGGKRANGSRRE